MRSKSTWKAQAALGVAALLAVSLAAAGAAGAKAAKAAGKPVAKVAARAKAAAAGTAGLEVTVYETKLPARLAGDINAKALQAKAATTAALQTALGELGETKVLYHAYQLASLAGDSRIHLGSRRPFVVSTRMLEGQPRGMIRTRTSAGEAEGGRARQPVTVRSTGRPRAPVTASPRSVPRINTVQYQNTGMNFELSIQPARVGQAGAVSARMSLELSVMADGSVEIAGGVKAPEIRQIEIKQTGQMRLGQAVLAIQVDAASPAKGAVATAYVCRVLLSEAP